MLGPVGETEFDIRFYVLGIPVRIHPIFWVGSLFVVWNSTNVPQHKIIGVFCVLLSILVHELGHAIVIRRNGFPSEIVLYAMGGYATSRGFAAWRQVWVSFAGPLAGFVLYGVVRVIILVVASSQPDFLFARGQEMPLGYALWLLSYINLYWGLLNLLPVSPLDGGQIMNALMLRYWKKKAVERSMQISILVAGAVCYWAFINQERFLLILFGILCANNVIAYNERNQFRRW